MDYSGLKVKDGRLINDRPVGKSGIEEAAELRKMMLKNEKISVVSQGMQRAEEAKDMGKFIKRHFI
tara:strand:+ start:4053 stop:4250 length:198 start_codon:yes stop_codon:yes gene_type:complete